MPPDYHTNPSIGRGATLDRSRTLIRPERQQQQKALLGEKETGRFDPWVIFSRIVTFWAPSFLLAKLGKTEPEMQQAWREKIALCLIIAILCALVAFLTVGLQYVLCRPEDVENTQAYLFFNDSSLRGSLVSIQGMLYNVSVSKVPPQVNFYEKARVAGTDVTGYFQRAPVAACSDPKIAAFLPITFDPCSSNNGFDGCPFPAVSGSNPSPFGLQNIRRQVGFDWGQLSHPALKNYLVLQEAVLNFDPYLNAQPQPTGDALDAAIRGVLKSNTDGKDATFLFNRRSDLQPTIKCLIEKYYAGRVAYANSGCFATTIFLLIMLIMVLSIIITRFAMALLFSWFISWRLARKPRERAFEEQATRLMQDNQFEMLSRKPTPWEGHVMPSSPARQISGENIGNDLFTILLITCYSEGEESIRNTIQSLAETDYPDERKLLFIIADGQITGVGNKRSTPDICIGMMEEDPKFRNPKPKSYVAVAQGSKQHNMAKVYVGHYFVKWGTPEEQTKPKPGNRGKRDSQLILMNFFSRVILNERMTALDYDIFRKIHYIMGVTPDFFEIVLMVDADTKVYADSLRLMVNCMVNDGRIMGLCGETKIANKRDSWVTAIQVYEYYISHHLGKAFEAVFGGVTCLPGCFCMYRIKARKGNNDWVPILTKPEICQEYSLNTVDTLHQKNLLLLGEDRFLTTLMLRNFPHRKMMFLPQAICKTVVPDQFYVLLSQRRRWINSTIHNLLELILVRNLCGTFCFSMQFVVFLDLIGTVSLPIGLALTFALIIMISLTPITSFASAIPLILLLLVLFSPAILILLTSRKLVYVMWMLIYLLALPVWNFILPLYAYWHFDDFSWGETRKISGEKKGDHHGNKDGQFDSSKLMMKRWEDWERYRVRKQKRMERQMQELAGIVPYGAHPTPSYASAARPSVPLEETGVPLMRPPPGATRFFEIGEKEFIRDVEERSETSDRSTSHSQGRGDVHSSLYPRTAATAATPSSQPYSPLSQLSWGPAGRLLHHGQFHQFSFDGHRIGQELVWRVSHDHAIIFGGGFGSLEGYGIKYPWELVIGDPVVLAPCALELHDSQETCLR
ncbi:uncharacterized protein VTP21DRAFT_10743 [Calcarisporiella thermophila]|uniref:uncharacterized protein n=1 Tax=Calcarisporiella thermophila TaxID=911321 RepID=UPI0037442FC5